MTSYITQWTLILLGVCLIKHAASWLVGSLLDWTYQDLTGWEFVWQKILQSDWLEFDWPNMLQADWLGICFTEHTVSWLVGSLLWLNRLYADWLGICFDQTGCKLIGWEFALLNMLWTDWEFALIKRVVSWLVRVCFDQRGWKVIGWVFALLNILWADCLNVRDLIGWEIALLNKLERDWLRVCVTEHIETRASCYIYCPHCLH